MYREWLQEGFSQAGFAGAPHGEAVSCTLDVGIYKFRKLTVAVSLSHNRSLNGVCSARLPSSVTLLPFPTACPWIAHLSSTPLNSSRTPCRLDLSWLPACTWSSLVTALRCGTAWISLCSSAHQQTCFKITSPKPSIAPFTLRLQRPVPRLYLT